MSIVQFVSGGESEQFRIDSGRRQGYIMSPWLFNIYMDAMMKKVKIGRGVSFLDDERVEIAWPLVCR